MSLLEAEPNSGKTHMLCTWSLLDGPLAYTRVESGDHAKYQSGLAKANPSSRGAGSSVLSPNLMSKTNSPRASTYARNEPLSEITAEFRRSLGSFLVS